MKAPTPLEAPIRRSPNSTEEFAWIFAVSPSHLMLDFWPTALDAALVLKETAIDYFHESRTDHNGQHKLLTWLRLGWPHRSLTVGGSS